MKTLSRDTDPQAEAVQVELLRQASVARRLALMRSLTAFAIRSSRRAIARRRPQASACEVLLAWVEIHYGSELGMRVRACLDQPSSG